MIDLSKSDDDFLEERFKDWLKIASRDFRHGFEDCIQCNFQHRPATDMYLAGYADGYALTQMRDASQHAGETL